MIYNLPLNYPRPIAKTKAEQRRDHAIEAIIAARVENYGETIEHALCRLIGIGPLWALAGSVIEYELSVAIRRSPGALLRRAGTAWAPSYPRAQRVYEETKDWEV